MKLTQEQRVEAALSMTVGARERLERVANLTHWSLKEAKDIERVALNIKSIERKLEEKKRRFDLANR